MGNDGGSIPTRRELVKEAARNPTTTELKATQSESQQYHWTHDPLSREPLSKPVVSDSNGKLYNKASILEFLLPSASVDSPTDDNIIRKEEADRVLQGAVKSLKDVVEVHFELDDTPTSNNDIDKKSAWKCPITASRLGPGSKAVYLVPCGHAFSGAAIKEVSTTKCLVCDADYAPNDVIPILPIDTEQIARLLLRAKTLREKGLTHSLKKAAKEKGTKKRKNRSDQTLTETEKGQVDEDVVPELVKSNTNTNSTKKNAGTSAAITTTTTTTTKSTSSSNIRNFNTASITAKVMAEQEIHKRQRLENNDNLKTLFSSRDQTKPHGKSADFMTRGFDIPASAKR